MSATAQIRQDDTWRISVTVPGRHTTRTLSSAAELDLSDARARLTGIAVDLASDWLPHRADPRYAAAAETATAFLAQTARELQGASAPTTLRGHGYEFTITRDAA